MGKYLTIAGSFIIALFYTLFRSKAREVEILKKVTKSQEESLRISDAKEEVSNTLHIQLEERYKEITEATKELKRETSKDDDVVMSSEFIRLLNDRDIQD